MSDHFEWVKTRVAEELLCLSERSLLRLRKNKSAMRLERELERLRQRVQQISIEQAPPTLRMVMIKDEIIPIDLTVWDLPITVESK